MNEEPSSNFTSLKLQDRKSLVTAARVTSAPVKLACARVFGMDHIPLGQEGDGVESIRVKSGSGVGILGQGILSRQGSLKTQL